ncbi:MAG TPA: hypothetical protein VLR71_00730 [Casimicrobiaceae bacterium]|nr:hypothetical protein [Casimicrobiaceae bacterium]
MKSRTLIAHHRYFGVDAVRLRTAAGRVLTRVVGLPPGRARVRADHLKHDFAVDTVEGDALLHELVDGGLLRPAAEAPGDFEVTDRFREFAVARVVEPLARARARQLVARACDIARHVNAEWNRNPLVIEALAVSGSYMSRDAELSDLVLGVVVRSRDAQRRARWGRMGNKQAGAQAIRTELQALSSFVAVHFATDAAELPRPFAIVFHDDQA